MDVISSFATSECAWCGRTMREDHATASGSYGICLTCLGDQFGSPIEDVARLDAATADQLPFGFIRMDPEGRIIAYNTKESALSGLPPQGVLGKNFFRTIAPCTCVDEFEGTLRRMFSTGKREREQIQFLFKFKSAAVMVDIAMTTDPSTGYAVLLIRKMKED